MRRRDNAYSRIIGMLKLVLPLAALALLSMLFLLARTIDPEDALPWATVNIEELLNDPRLTAPVYSGVADNGDEVLFTAQTAHPGGGGDDGARAKDALLRLIGPAGGETRARSEEARLRPDRGFVEMTGNVVVDTDSGYRVESQQMIANLDRSRVVSPVATVSTAPGTTIYSGALQLDRQEGGGAEVLVFNKGVRLLYQPQPAANRPAP